MTYAILVSLKKIPTIPEKNNENWNFPVFSTLEGFMQFKIIALLSLTFFPSLTYASCECVANVGEQKLLGKTVQNVDVCKSEIVEEIYHQFKLGLNCQNQKVVEASWSCGTKNIELKKFECELFSEMHTTQTNLVLVNSLSGILNQGVVPEVCEAEDETDKPKFDPNYTSQLTPLGFQINIKNEDELKATAKQLGLSPSEVMDKLKGGAVTLIFTNDNLVTDMGKGKKSNDRGNTHSLLLKIDKTIGSGEYVLTTSYESNLFTQFTNPEKPDYRKDANKVTHVSQYFVEENIAKMTLSKAKSGDAFYWSAGGGLQQLNKDDIDNPIFLSALNQQKAFHDVFIKHQLEKNPGGKIATKIYDNKPKSGSENGFMLEGSFGKQETIGLLSGSRVRTYVDGSFGGRATTASDASFVKGEASVNTDIKITNSNAARFTAGTRANVYMDSQVQTEKFANMGMAGKRFEVGMNYVRPDDNKLAQYQNPLPKDMVRREELAPQRNKFYQIYFKVKW